MFGSDGMLGRGILAGIGGRVIFGTEGNVGKDGNGVLAVGSVGKDVMLGNGGNVAAVGKLGIVGNCGIVG
uniref:Receptor kinase n=1 Tax=Solanum tuberosum TaxID=4113 RepID=M1C6D3_SOLTU